MYEDNIISMQHLWTDERNDKKKVCIILTLFDIKTNYDSFEHFIILL